MFNQKVYVYFTSVNMQVEVDTLRPLAQPQGELHLNFKQHPELSENRTVWKSDNQRFKEATLPLTGT